MFQTSIAVHGGYCSSCTCSVPQYSAMYHSVVHQNKWKISPAHVSSKVLDISQDSSKTIWTEVQNILRNKEQLQRNVCGQHLLSSVSTGLPYWHHTNLGELSNHSVTHLVKGTRHLTVKIRQYIFIKYYEAAWSNNSIYTAVGKAGKASAARYTRIIWSHEYMPYLVICAISCKYCATQVFVINLV